MAPVTWVDKGPNPVKKIQMTEALNPPDEPQPKPLCEACAGIQRNWRRAKGHAELAQGLNRKEPRRHGQVTITEYQCERCGTHWDYENDKNNLHAGWSVVAR
jgi:hypothetical protein